MGREEGDATAAKQEVNPEAEIEQPHEQDVSTAFLWRPYNKGCVTRGGQLWNTLPPVPSNKPEGRLKAQPASCRPTSTKM